MAEPAPDRALPGDAVPRSTRMVDPPRLQQMLLSDGTWAECEVVAQARNRPGGWRVLVRWYDPGPPRAQREDWVVYSAGLFREPALAISSCSIASAASSRAFTSPLASSE